ncbi:hypothetical protein PVAP13_7KG184600 [Panicum virgatum]|uniref:DUF4057 domain-containing protein n=1 Tax=Panicum virgatum TaxID=38727 RepID=A0A8T0QH83_PANVG|nr:hypothetical protein PVAP13_7KG184600 [Panicum virgatum]
MSYEQSRDRGGARVDGYLYCTNPPHRQIFSKRGVRLSRPFRAGGSAERKHPSSASPPPRRPQPLLRRQEGREGGRGSSAMERAVPVRKPHTSTADLLTWSAAGPDAAAGASPAASSRPSLKPAAGITPAMFGAPVSEQEAEDLSKSERKFCSGSKLKEMSGSGIFAEKSENGESEASSHANKTSVRMYQQTVTGISQISFSADGSVSPKKPSSIPEVAKQRELSGTLEDADAKINKQLSEAKTKELSGSDIFGPPPEIPARPLAARNISFSEEPVVKTAKKIHNQKFQELTGNNIFKEEAPASAEKSLSSAKLKEMSGSDIFADGTPAPREYLGGVRKPPGGESSIALI